MSIGNLAALIAVVTAVAGGLSSLLTHWLNRRAASGRVATSEAAVLWQQSQDIRAMLLAEKDRAEEQRDRLIAAYTEQVFPVLAEIRDALTSLSRVVADGVHTVHEIKSAQGEEAAREAAAPGP